MNSARQKAFERSKQMLLDAPVLVHYNPAKELVFSCDASPYGIGAVLSHIGPAGEEPVPFASSKLNVTERKYSKLDKEICL